MEIANDETVTVTEEVDGGVQTVSAKLPMIVTTDLRYAHRGLFEELIVDSMNHGMHHCRIS